MSMSIVLYIVVAIFIGRFGASKIIKSHKMIIEKQSPDLVRIAKKDRIFGILIIVSAFIFITMVILIK